MGDNFTVLRRRIYLNTEKITHRITLTDSHYQLWNKLLVNMGGINGFLFQHLFWCVWITQTISTGKCAPGQTTCAHVCVSVCVFAHKWLRWKPECSLSCIDRGLRRCSCFVFCRCCTFNTLSLPNTPVQPCQLKWANCLSLSLFLIFILAPSLSRCSSTHTQRPLALSFLLLCLCLTCTVSKRPSLIWIPSKNCTWS